MTGAELIDKIDNGSDIMYLSNEKKVFSAIDAAAAEYFKEGKITQRCPMCGGEMTCITKGNSYEVKCNDGGCISEWFSGI